VRLRLLELLLLELRLCLHLLRLLLELLLHLLLCVLLLELCLLHQLLRLLLRLLQSGRVLGQAQAAAAQVLEHLRVPPAQRLLTKALVARPSCCRCRCCYCCRRPGTSARHVPRVAPQLRRRRRSRSTGAALLRLRLCLRQAGHAAQAAAGVVLLLLLLLLRRRLVANGAAVLHHRCHRHQGWLRRRLGSRHERGAVGGERRAGAGPQPRLQAARESGVSARRSGRAALIVSCCAGGQQRLVARARAGCCAAPRGTARPTWK
jgi:hypothetical protein